MTISHTTRTWQLPARGKTLKKKKKQEHVSVIVVVITIIILQFSHSFSRHPNQHFHIDSNTAPFPFTTNYYLQRITIASATISLRFRRINGDSRVAWSNQETRRFVPRIPRPLRLSTRNNYSSQKKKKQNRKRNFSFIRLFFQCIMLLTLCGVVVG